MAEKTVGLVFVFFTLGGAELSAHVDAFFEDAADEGFGGVPGAMLCLFVTEWTVSVDFGLKLVWEIGVGDRRTVGDVVLHTSVRVDFQFLGL